MNRLVVPLALFLFLPLFGLVAPFLIAANTGVSELVATDTLTHLWNYVLRDYIASTLLLILGVSIGVLILGVGNAWIVASYQFPGKRIFEWALILPLAIPTYVMAYLFVDLLQFSGPIQSGLRDLLGLSALPYFPDPRSFAGAIWTFFILPLSVCVSHLTHCIFRAQPPPD